MEGQIGARAENRDLGHEPDELRRTADPEIPVERLALHCQGRRLPAPPMKNALAQHSHRIDHLRISRQRLGRRIGLCGMQARPRRSDVAFWLISAISARTKPATTAM